MAHAWIGIFFLSLVGKNPQILHIHQCKKRKLRIPPNLMYRFSCSFVCGHFLDVYSVSTKTKKIYRFETPPRSQVGPKNKPSIYISSWHSNDIWVLKESSICSLTL